MSKMGWKVNYGGRLQVSVYVSKEEYKKLKEKAENENRSVSNFVRNLILKNI